MVAEKTPPATPAPTPSPAVVSAGPRVRLTVEHPLQSGHLTVWVDGALRYETELRARTTRRGVVGGRVPDGRLEDAFDVAPGKHQIRVEIAWEGNRKSETILGAFEPTEAKELQVRLGGLTKSVSLEWRR